MNTNRSFRASELAMPDSEMRSAFRKSFSPSTPNNPSNMMMQYAEHTYRNCSELEHINGGSFLRLSVVLEDPVQTPSSPTPPINDVVASETAPGVGHSSLPLDNTSMLLVATAGDTNHRGQMRSETRPAEGAEADTLAARSLSNERGLLPEMMVMMMTTANVNVNVNVNVGAAGSAVRAVDNQYSYV